MKDKKYLKYFYDITIKKVWFKRFFILFVFLYLNQILWAIDTELLYYFRSSQWKEIINFFKKQSPKTKEHHFVFAKALEKEKKSNNQNGEVIRLYLLSAGIDCKDNFTTCLNTYKNVEGILNNLSLLKAQNIAKEQKQTSLQLQILFKADFNQNDVITRALFREMTQLVYNHFDSLSQNQRDYFFYLIENRKNLLSPLSSYYIAKLYDKLNQKDKSIQFYFQAALSTTSENTLNLIANELKDNISSIPYNYYRNFTVFYQSDPFRKALKQFSNSQILQTTSDKTIFYDGKYFIQLKDWQSLYQLANVGYSFLSQNPEILESWLQDCYKQKEYDTILKIINVFKHVKYYQENLWKIYLYTLKELTEKDNKYKETYFNEILEYLNYFHYDIDGYDLLMGFLIVQKNPDNLEKFTFEEKKYWEKAFKKIPHQTEAGRFFYWLYYYYKYFIKNYELSKIVEENFYYYAPGSYYIQVIWDEIKKNPKDFKSHWNQVNSLTDYYKWIVYHGYKDEALMFLSTKRLSYFYNPKALELQNVLTSSNIYIPEEIIFLFRYGEYQFGFDLFKEYYKNRSTKIDYLKYLVIAGQKSENRFIEVHFLRQLIRALNIPEDPFTLPPYLLSRLYPRPYRELVKKYGKEYNISEDAIYALMRQESMFREDAISRSGARGLMQIMPKTGAWLTSKLKINDYDLLHPETSIQLGAKFFSDLLKKYNNDFRWAAVAYNGGPGNLEKWKKKYYHNDFNYFLEILPVKESRNYCRKTYQNYLHYKISRILYDEGIRSF